MATIFYVEHRNFDGTVYRREPVGSLHEARDVLIEMLNDAQELAIGDVLTIVEGGDKE